MPYLVRLCRKCPGYFLHVWQVKTFDTGIVMNSAKSYQPLWMGALTGLAALILWYFSSLAIDKKIVPTAGAILPFITAGFGAFCGSYFAFMLRKHEEKQAKLNERKVAFDACLFALFRQYKAMYMVKTHYDEHSDELDRALFMTAGSLGDQKDNKIKFDDMSFLSELDEIVHLIELTDLQYRFEMAVINVERRARHHIEILGPAVYAKLDEHGDYTYEQLREILGIPIYHGAINYTNQAYESVQLNIIDNQRLHMKTWEIAKKTFPGKKFLRPTIRP